MSIIKRNGNKNKYCQELNNKNIPGANYHPQYKYFLSPLYEKS